MSQNETGESQNETGESRNCYCSTLDEHPEIFLEQSLPKGFCGTCQRCGELGHTRHFPGPMPYTGAWCDKCYEDIAKISFLKIPIIWIGIILLSAYIYLKYLN